jgi:hypothetical protein
VGGREMVQQVESEWSVAPLDSARIKVIEAVSYPTPEGRLTLRFDSILPCRRSIANAVPSP